MVLLLSEAEVARTITMSEAVDQLDDVFRQYAAGTALMTPRTSAQIPGGGGAFRVMSAILPESGYFGLKTLTGSPGRRLANETYFVILLFEIKTGALRAMMGAGHITGLRTGAATGLAARYMSKTTSRVAGVFGVGFQARWQVAALKAARPLQEVRVFHPDQERAAAFATEIAKEFDLKAVAVREAEQAVRDCDLVVAATSSTVPVFEGEWLTQGTHVSGVGSNSPAKEELDTVTFSRSQKVVVDFREQVLEEAGDLLRAIQTGAIAVDSIHADLAELASGAKVGRTHDSEITLFKSVGVALEDIVTASFVYEQAIRRGIGRELDLHGRKDRMPAEVAVAHQGAAVAARQVS